MNENLQWLSEAGGWIGSNFVTLAQVLASGVTAVATYALWRATRVLAIETAVLANMTAQPFVVCWLRSSSAGANTMNLTLRNTGNATAFDVKLRVSPALPEPNAVSKATSDESTFDASLLPPGESLPVWPVLSNELQGAEYSAEVSWSRTPGAAERQELRYRFSAKDGFHAGWTVKGTHQIAQEIEKLRKEIAK